MSQNKLVEDHRLEAREDEPEDLYRDDIPINDIVMVKGTSISITVVCAILIKLIVHLL
jgi:hypothetical protein